MLWSELDYWTTEEWRILEVYLAAIEYCPGRENLFRALDLCPFDTVKCVILGQDPYPNPHLATGLAFSIPPEIKDIPVTLQRIIRELNSDVAVYPENGDLSEWAQEGVLLWNVYPTCLPGKSLSHRFNGWSLLTQEILERLSAKGIVFNLWGKKAERFRCYIDEDESDVIVTTHPSPRAAAASTAKSQFRRAQSFLGSRPFSTTNTKLVELGHEPIDWRTKL